MIRLAGSIVGISMLVAAPASAQKYDPAYPVCSEIYGSDGSVIECYFTTMEQCKANATGMAAICINNPYYKPSAAPAAVETAPEPGPAAASPAPTKKKPKRAVAAPAGQAPPAAK